jgi:hypothetical protein
MIALVGACGAKHADDASALGAGNLDGTLGFSWQITDNASNPLSCPDVAAVLVTVAAVRQRDGLEVDDAYTCGAGSALGRLFPPGIYDLQLDLIASRGRSLLAAPIQVGSVEVMSGADTALAPVSFAVKPFGSLSFSVSADVTGTNCGTGVNDARLTGVRLELESGTVCVPTTFTINGVSTASTCSTPLVVSCFEKGTSVTASGIGSGNRSLLVQGQRATTPCYTRATPVAVPGNDLEVDAGVMTLRFDDTVSCPP